MEIIMQNIVSLILWLVIIIAVVNVTVIRKSKNRKAAQSGEDRERVRNASAPLLRESDNAPLIYAHWEERESYGRTVKTTYHRFVVAYRDQTLWVSPFFIDKKTREMGLDRPKVLSTDNLGKITVTKKEKNGEIRQVKVWLADKQGHVLSQFDVEAENWRKNRWFPVNILQYEECAAFTRFIEALAARVAAENPGVDDLIKAEANEGLGVIGAIVSVVGAVFSIFFPPLGAAIALVGLLMSAISKLRGASGIIFLIVSIVCALVGAGFIWMYFTIM